MKKQALARNLIWQLYSRLELDQAMGAFFQRLSMPTAMDLTQVIDSSEERPHPSVPEEVTNDGPIPVSASSGRSSITDALESSFLQAEGSTVRSSINPWNAAGGCQKVEISALPLLEDPAAAHAELVTEALACQRCALAERRHHVVFGRGALDSDLFFLTEAPDREEDLYGQLFIGRAGELLAAMIEKGMGRSRDSVYVSSLVKCRPHHNRELHPDEVAACNAYLETQLQIVRPKVIISLGLIAGQVLSGQRASMRRLRGEVFRYRGIPVIPTYHPSHLVTARERAGGKTREDRETWEDLKRAMQLLKGSR
ncbi:MAG: uracil-DNA glycosylase [Planctomycetota bacterium]|jgi:DNA polymerase